MKTIFLHQSALLLKTVVIAILFITQLSAQNSNGKYTLPLKTGDKMLGKNIQQTSKVENILTKQLFDGKSRVLLQFYQLPNDVIRRKMQDLGIELTQYVAANTYRASIPLGTDVQTLIELNVRSVDSFTAIDKIEPLLLLDSLPEYVAVVLGKLDVRLKFERNIDVNAVKKALQVFEVEYLEKEQKNYNFLDVRIPQEKLERIAAMPFISYIYPATSAARPLGAMQGTSVRSEYLNNFYGLKGEGVNVAIFEDEDVEERIDLNNVIPLSTQGACDWHPTSVAGMLGGRGILRPTFQGVAPKVKMFKENSQYITDAHIDGTATSQGLVDRGVVAINYSVQIYPIGEHGEYESEAILADQQHLDYPVLQVIPAGNTGHYLPSRTIATGRQCAKNVTTVGNINKQNQIHYSSSTGPTADGRLKPEIVAIGNGASMATCDFDADAPASTSGSSGDVYHTFYGTSFATPQVTGGLALLYQYYRSQHNGADPNNALMKAVICNTADDLGNPGPDYTFGFGKMNLRKARKALEQNWTYNNSFTSTGSQTFNGITIPANKYHQLKVMLYWADPLPDPTGMQSAPKLVNNLDLSVTPPGGISQKPLVLNPSASNDLAVQGLDVLNNIEQVVITAPSQFLSSGTYSVDVNPTNLTSNQPYYIVWELIEPGVTITSPHPGENIARIGVNNYEIEWDYYGDDPGSFKITILDGNSVLHTYNNIDGNARLYKWTKPDMFNKNLSDLTVRVDRLDATGITVVYSDESNFDIYNAVNPKTLQTNYMCDNKVCLSWNIESNYQGNITNGTPPAYFTIYKYVDEYDGQFLGYMKPILTTSDYSTTIEFDPTKAVEWYAVSTTYYNGSEYIETVRCDAEQFVIPNNISCNGNETCSANCSPEIVGTSCNDDDPCTTNDIYDADCNCVGTIVDSNNDGVPDSGTCNDCPINLVIEDSDISGDYEAANFIKTDEDVPVSVNAGEQLTLNAGKYIELNPGFSAEATTAYGLYAYIEGCEPSMQRNTSNTRNNEEMLKSQFSVKHFPNPFREEVTLELQLNFDAEVTINISDVNGKIIKQIQAEYLNQDTQVLTILTQNWIPGIYFYHISVKNQNTGILRYTNGTFAKM